MPPIKKQQAVRYQEERPNPIEDALIIEEPLQININGRPFSITMRTPGADDALVKGLLFTEGVVKLEGLEDAVEITQREGYTEANVTVPEIFLCENLLEKRSLIANASCGFCGKKEIEDIAIKMNQLVTPKPLPAELIAPMQEKMRQQQAAFAATGGCHAAGIFSLLGELETLHEDVGRHNAVDKVIGDLVIKKSINDSHVLFVSGRVSFEIVSKAYAAGIPFLCAVSSPSSLAVEMATHLGITLVAFCRENRFTVYSNSHTIESSYVDS